MLPILAIMMGLAITFAVMSARARAAARAATDPEMKAAHEADANRRQMHSKIVSWIGIGVVALYFVGTRM